jgi:hypothetical protein
MLPNSFKVEVGALLSKDCGNDSGILPEELYALHAQLWFFLQTQWFSAPNSSLLASLSLLVDLKKNLARTETAQGTLAGAVLCSYYSFAEGNTPKIDDWAASVRRDLRLQRHSAPY